MAKRKKTASKLPLLSPGMTVMVKLGSIAVHADEYLSGDGHQFDAAALEQLLGDSEVQAWLAEMDKLALLPKKRKTKP